MSWTQQRSRLLSPGSLDSMMVICVLVSKLPEGRAHLTSIYSFLNTLKKKGGESKADSLKKKVIMDDFMVFFSYLLHSILGASLSPI